ncbi:MAG: alpha/beta fold hydrolase [Ktedonobacteraceae bacterium]
MQNNNPYENPANISTSSKSIRLAYGTEDQQFGDLYLPKHSGPHPIVILIHGGYWRSRYGLGLMNGLAADLAKRSYATWNIEYRRVGNMGGGWPGTLQDVALATDYLRKLAPSYGLDLKKVVPIGHSAGGHLAFWLAARPRIPFFTYNNPLAGSQLPGENEEIATPLDLAGTISLAGVVDLEMAWKLHLSNNAVVELLGGTPANVPERYTVASPAALLPLGVQQVLIHGTNDDSVPIEVSQAYVNAARSLNDRITFIELEGVDHFDVINPHSEAWTIATRELQKLVN